MVDNQSGSCLKMSLNVTSYPRLCNVSKEAFNILLLRESVWLFANRVKLWRLTPATFARSVRVGTYRRSETGLSFSVLSAWAKNCLMQTFTVIAPHNWISWILPRLIKVVKQCNANVDNKRISCYTLTESKKHTLLLGGTSALFRKDSVMPACGTSLPLFLNYVNIPQDYQKPNNGFACSIQALPSLKYLKQGAVSVATSKLQRRVKERLQLLLQGHEVIESFYPEWLINPETGRRMEIDLWLPSIKVAIEVQGKQHYEFTPHFHESPKKFREQLYRDQVKRSLCENNGVRFYEVCNLEDIDHFIEDVRKYYKEVSIFLFNKNSAIKSLAYYAANLHRLNEQKSPPPGKVEKIIRRMSFISEKYNIPLRLVEPDFSLDKMHVAFPDKPIVRVKFIGSQGQRTISVKAAILAVRRKTALLRWNDTGSNGRQYIDMLFDLTTGYSIEKMDPIARIKLLSIPDLSKYPSIYRRGFKKDE